MSSEQMVGTEGATAPPSLPLVDRIAATREAFRQRGRRAPHGAGIPKAEHKARLARLCAENDITVSEYQSGGAVVSQVNRDPKEYGDLIEWLNKWGASPAYVEMVSRREGRLHRTQPPGKGDLRMPYKDVTLPVEATPSAIDNAVANLESTYELLAQIDPRYTDRERGLALRRVSMRINTIGHHLARTESR